MNQKSHALSFKYLLVLIVLIPISVFAQKNKVLIISDTWPQMDVLADGLTEHGYIINKAEEEEIESGISGFDFVFMYIHKTYFPKRNAH